MGSNTKEMEVERRRLQKKREKELKKALKAARNQRTQKKDEDDNPEIHDGLDDLGFDDGNQKDYRFTLFDRGDEMDSDDMHFWIKRLLKKTKWPETHPLLKGLDRGIGLHHEGLPLQYRQLVETLFRAKMIKLVVTVASLAMGVNMPARSVVFAGDNKELYPLNYRQMMGRAGRRGYDNIGHVIFFGISPRKISYLMTSQLTSLNGHYPILSTTSSIRCTQLLLNSMNDQDVDDKYYIGLVKNLFHQPFNYKTGKLLNRVDIMNKFRYSLEYHLQNGLLSVSNLNIDTLGDLANVLHEYEPNNFLFIKLLQSGFLHEICKGYTKLSGDHNSKLKKDILLKLLLVLCLIFELHPVPVSYKPPPSKSNRYLSKSYLTLPETEKRLLNNHNFSKEEIEVIEKIDKYRYNFLSHYYNLYQKQYNKSEIVDNVSNIYGSENIINYIEYYLKYYDGGIFGHNQIFLKDFRGRNLKKNCYVYDFYVHEDYKRIVDESSLRDGLAWKKLKRFQLLLSIINKSLNHVSSLKSKQDLINEEVKAKIEVFESGLQKLRQHKFSIYRHQQQFWMDNDGKLWKRWEIEKYKQDLKLKAIGDDFVMAFQDLTKDYTSKFKHIVPIGPISNYDQIQVQQQQQPAQPTAADAVQQPPAVTNGNKNKNDNNNNNKQNTTTTTNE